MKKNHSNTGIKISTLFKQATKETVVRAFRAEGINSKNGNKVTITKQNYGDLTIAINKIWTDEEKPEIFEIQVIKISA
ncbi:hypothetical protein KJ840_03345 [Patescibacteria group bacterium]|nr:hypothetical protein [Patescibacteria group bacterium]